MLVLLLPPNMVLPVVLLLFEPNMLEPVFVLEPKPEAEGELDTICREGRGARGGRIAAVAKGRSPVSKEEIKLTSIVVIVIACPKATEAAGLIVVVGAKAAEATAEGHVELVRRVARV